MSYIESSLVAGERVEHRAKAHWAVFCGPALIMAVGLGLMMSGKGGLAVLGFLLLGAGMLRGAGRALAAWSTELAITDRRVIGKTGLLSRQTTELRHQKVETIQVSQGILGRMMGFGTVTVVGSGGTKAAFTGIGDPLAFRNRAAQMADSAT